MVRNHKWYDLPRLVIVNDLYSFDPNAKVSIGGCRYRAGVIRPGDPMEFVSVKVDFKVLPAFKPGAIPKPVLYDASGKAYNSAQTFGEIGAAPAFACTFSFRVPKGTTVTQFAIDTLSITLAQ
jgi:hypothetical protein